MEAAITKLNSGKGDNVYPQSSIVKKPGNRRKIDNDFTPNTNRLVTIAMTKPKTKPVTTASASARERPDVCLLDSGLNFFMYVKNN